MDITSEWRILIYSRILSSLIIRFNLYIWVTGASCVCSSQPSSKSCALLSSDLLYIILTLPFCLHVLQMSSTLKHGWVRSVPTSMFFFLLPLIKDMGHSIQANIYFSCRMKRLIQSHLNTITGYRSSHRTGDGSCSTMQADIHSQVCHTNSALLGHNIFVLLPCNSQCSCQ